MDDIAEQDQLGRVIIGDEGFDSVDGIVGDIDGHQLAGVPVGPEIAEVKIGDDERVLCGQPEGM